MHGRAHHLKRRENEASERPAAPSVNTSLAKNIAIAYLACLAAFSLLLVGAFAIPHTAVHDNAKRSLATLETEGTYARVLDSSPAWQKDNYTAALMLNIATHGDGVGAYGAFSAFYYDDPVFADNKIASLKVGLDMEADPSNPLWVPYARYWHGWMVVFKPLLMACDLATMRIVFLVLLGVLAAALLVLLWRRIGPGALAPLVALLAVNAPVAMMSPSLAFSILLAEAACIVLVLVEGRSNTRKAQVAGMHARFAVTFFVFGAITVYLDLLCTPLLTLGLPLALHFALNREGIQGGSGLGRALGGLLGLSAAWGAGYALLWVSKWLLSTIICGWDVLGNAQMSAAIRTSTEALGAQHTALGAIRGNLETWLPFGALVALGVAWLMLFVLAVVATQRSGKPGHWTAFFAVLACGLLPLAWFAVLLNHSWTHAWFTYRELAISLNALLLALWVLVPAGARLRQARPAQHASAPAGAGNARTTYSEPVPRGQAVSGRQRSQSLVYLQDDYFTDYDDYNSYVDDEEE